MYGMPVSSRHAEFVAVWNGAARRLLSFGVGMSRVSKEEQLIRDTVARGVEVHIVMVDPEWVLGSRTASAIFENFYRQKRFGEKFYQAYSDLSRMAVGVNAGYDRERMRIYTYQSMITQSATIADPGSPEAFGLLELHTYGRYADRIRTLLPGPGGRGLLLDQKLRSISNLAGHDFTRENPDDATPNRSFALAQ